MYAWLKVLKFSIYIEIIADTNAFTQKARNDFCARLELHVDYIAEEKEMTLGFVRPEPKSTAGLWQWCTGPLFLATWNFENSEMPLLTFGRAQFTKILFSGGIFPWNRERFSACACEQNQRQCLESLNESRPRDVQMRQTNISAQALSCS